MSRKSPESAFYAALRKALPNSIKSDRIESHQTSVGFPDLILHHDSKSAFIELKSNGVYPSAEESAIESIIVNG